MPASIAKPPAWQGRAAEVLSRYIQSGPDPGVEQALGAADSGQAYLHWDEFRHRPVPPKWTAADLWTLIDELFLHPLTRAILIHHQLAYDHLFADGNGRTARALFMWSVLRSGYGWFRWLSISRAVNEAKARYYRAFQYVQSDDGDTTYFVRQQLRCIEQEVDRLARFLERRVDLEHWLIAKKAISASLNARQLALVDHTLGDTEAAFTAAEHARYHGVTQPTAWKDLTTMVAQGLLEEGKSGRQSLYRPSGKLRKLIAKRPKGT